MNNHDPWEKDRGVSAEELSNRTHARRNLLEERTQAMLELCKGLSVSDIKTITDKVVARASAKAFFPNEGGDKTEWTIAKSKR